jgi:hypothetical protein
MAGLIDEFIGITNALNKKRIQYAVCDGWAMAIHGLLRTTIDIDLLILADDLATVKITAAEHGFDIEGLPLEFSGGSIKIRRISKIDSESKELITLDMLLVTDALKEVWERRKKVKWKAGEYQIVSVKGLKIMKEMSDRPQDKIDLDYLRGLDDED